MPEKINVALITEPQGPHIDIYIECLAGSAGVGEVSVADPSGAIFERVKSKLAGKSGTVHEYRDPQALLRERKPDLVIAAFSADHAPPIIEASLNAGAHVLAEKPGCVRAADFERLTKLAESKSRHLMLTFSTRMNPFVQKAHELVHNGALGKLYGASLYFIADQTRLRKPEYQKSWFASKERAGGGHLIWLGIHYVDLLQHITGQKVARVGGFAANVGGQPMRVEDSASVVMELDRGMVATLQSGYYLDRNYQSQIRIWGAEGWLSADLVAGTPLEWHLNSKPGVEQMPANPDAVTASYPKFIQAAVDAARGAGPAPVTGAECLATLKAVFGLYKAAETGVTQQIS
jgi:predicted dehydrogenase